MKLPLICLIWVLATAAGMHDSVFAAAADPVDESSLTGRIVGKRGKPLFQATVTAATLNPGTRAQIVAGVAHTDAAGKFTLNGLRTGQRYRVLIQTEDLSTANTERTVIAGSGPIDVALKAAVAVKLAITGLPGVPGVGDSRSIGVQIGLNKLTVESELRAPPDLNEGPKFSRDPEPVILMEWLDPDSGVWLPVLSPRHVTVKDATPVQTRADLQFKQVPVGTVRVRVLGMERIAAKTIDPVTIQAGRRTVIPVKVTALKEIEVKVTNRDGGPASGMMVHVEYEVSNANDVVGTATKTGMDGTCILMSDSTRDLKIDIKEAGKVVSTTSIRARSPPPERTVVHMQL